MLIFSESQFLVILDLSYGYFMQKVLCYQSLPLPNIRGDTIYLPPLLGNLQYLPDEEGFWWQIFLLLFIFTLDAFWPNLMAVSLQLLKLWLLFKGRCSQNRDFTVKTPYKWQILEVAVRYEQIFTISIVFIAFLIFSIVFKQ